MSEREADLLARLERAERRIKLLEQPDSTTAGDEILHIMSLQSPHGRTLIMGRLLARYKDDGFCR